jgi:uncharacterized protein (DUF433 family)
MVSVILDNVAAGVPGAAILARYPAIRSEDTDPAVAYAAELVRKAPWICRLSLRRDIQNRREPLG